MIAAMLQADALGGVVAPVLAAGSLFTFFIVVLRHRDGRLPVFEIGSVCAGITALYAMVPLVGFWLGGLKWSPLSDGLLYSNPPTIGQIAGVAWRYVLYLASFVAAYLWHQRKSGSQIVPSSDPIPSWLNRLLVICGSLLTLIAVLTFFFPGFLIPIFPWQLTPLTARSLSGWLIAVGTLMLWMSRENDRTRVRLATPMLILILPTLLMQMSRFAEQVNWGSPVLWVGLLLFAIAGFCGLYLANGSWREAAN